MHTLISAIPIEDKPIFYCVLLLYCVTRCLDPASRPIVTGVSPLFGPVAGGTLVTLSGQWLNYSDSLVILDPVGAAPYGAITLLNAGNRLVFSLFCTRILVLTLGIRIHWVS